MMGVSLGGYGSSDGGSNPNSPGYDSKEDVLKHNKRRGPVRGAMTHATSDGELDLSEEAHLTPSRGPECSTQRVPLAGAGAGHWSFPFPTSTYPPSPALPADRLGCGN